MVKKILDKIKEKLKGKGKEEKKKEEKPTKTETIETKSTDEGVEEQPKQPVSFGTEAAQMYNVNVNILAEIRALRADIGLLYEEIKKLLK